MIHENGHANFVSLHSYPMTEIADMMLRLKKKGIKDKALENCLGLHHFYLGKNPLGV